MKPYDDKLPLAFHNLPADKYPLKIEFIAEWTGEVVHTVTVDPTKEASRLQLTPIPGLAKDHGPVMARCTFGDGEVVTLASPLAQARAQTHGGKN